MVLRFTARSVGLRKTCQCTNIHINSKVKHQKVLSVKLRLVISNCLHAVHNTVTVTEIHVKLSGQIFKSIYRNDYHQSVNSQHFSKAYKPHDGEELLTTEILIY